MGEGDNTENRADYGNTIRITWDKMKIDYFEIQKCLISARMPWIATDESEELSTRTNSWQSEKHANLEMPAEEAANKAPWRAQMAEIRTLYLNMCYDAFMGLRLKNAYEFWTQWLELTPTVDFVGQSERSRATYHYWI